VYGISRGKMKAWTQEEKRNLLRVFAKNNTGRNVIKSRNMIKF